MDLGPVLAKAVPRLSKKAASHVAQVSRRTLPARAGLGIGSGIRDKYGNELEFPSAFRQCRRNGKPRGIVKIKYGGQP